MGELVQLRLRRNHDGAEADVGDAGGGVAVEPLKAFVVFGLGIVLGWGEEVEGADGKGLFEDGGELGVDVWVEALECVQGDGGGARKVGACMVEEDGEVGVDVAMDYAQWEVADSDGGEAWDEDEEFVPLAASFFVTCIE